MSFPWLGLTYAEGSQQDQEKKAVAVINAPLLHATFTYRA